MDTDWLPFNCVDCGVEGRRHTGRGRPRLRCDGCREAYKRADRHLGSDLVRCCPTCAGPVERGAHRTYCSDVCRWGRQECETCKAPFAPVGRGQRYCSRTCSGTPLKGVRPKWLVGARSLACVGCGVEVVTLGTRVLCASCREERAREHSRLKNRRRRAALYRVPSEPYTLAEIAQRDGFCCRLCDLPVDMRLLCPDRWAPTIDHVLPLVAGGDDTRANVQLAHFVCNSRKGGSVLEPAA